jgi:hypothetical protein
MIFVCCEVQQSSQLLYRILNTRVSLACFSSANSVYIGPMKDVSLATLYGLDDLGVGVHVLGGGGYEFSLLHVWAQPASYPVGTRGSFPGGKVAGA